MLLNFICMSSLARVHAVILIKMPAFLLPHTHRAASSNVQFSDQAGAIRATAAQLQPGGLQLVLAGFTSVVGMALWWTIGGTLPQSFEHTHVGADKKVKVREYMIEWHGSPEAILEAAVA